MYFNSPVLVSRIGINVEFLDHSGTNCLSAFSSSSVTSYKAFAPSTIAVGTVPNVKAIPAALVAPILYSGLSFFTILPVSLSRTHGVTLLPIVGLECFISFIACSAILVVVLIISDGKDMKLPTGKSLGVLTKSPTYE